MDKIGLSKIVLDSFIYAWCFFAGIWLGILLKEAYKRSKK